MKILPKVGIITGAFDLCHAGHIMFITEARNHCEYLIVALHLDPSKERPEKNKPIQSISERYLKLSALINVDEIIPYETEEELKELFLLIKPNIYFLGSDWKEKKHWAEEFGLIHYLERLHHQSSSNLRKRINENHF
jgi:glycerol-3-phosphate cytidylyltransferase